MNGTKEAGSLLTLEQVLRASDGVHVLGTGTFFITSVQTDSRKVVPGTLFVPLIGEKQDGHAYVPQALERGASAVFVCLRNYEADAAFFTGLSLKYPAVYFIGVEDTLAALQKVAACYVEQFDSLIRVGVTGSSGKTTTKEIAAAILSQKYSVITNEGNLNSETGLPLSVFAIRPEHQVGIFEMGMNRENEIGELAAILRPRFAIITNIGTAHIGRLGSREAIAAEKAKIFSYFHSFGTAFIPRDDAFAAYLAGQVDGNVVYYGEEDDSRIRFVADQGLEGTAFTVDGQPAVLPLPGRHNYHNARGSIALALVLGVEASQIVGGLGQLAPLFGRSQVLRGKYTIIQDCYNANPDSMEKALDFIASLGSAVRRVLVLGDMLELGAESLAAHARAGSLAARAGAAAAIFVGREMAAAAGEFRKAQPEVPLVQIDGCSDEAMRQAASAVEEFARKGDVILLKGSRGMGLERVAALLGGAE